MEVSGGKRVVLKEQKGRDGTDTNAIDSIAR